MIGRAVLRAAGRSAAMVAVLLLSSEHAGASAAGGARLPLAGITSLEGSREWVPLEPSGALLVGLSTSAAIDRITVIAPGVTTGHLILREQETAYGERVIAMSAPPSLAARTVRLVLFLRPSREPLQVLEYSERGWQVRHPHILPVGDDHSSLSRDIVLAVPLEGINPVRLVQPRAVDGATSWRWLPARSWAGLPAGGILRGILPWVCAATLLIAALRVSRWAHRHST